VAQASRGRMRAAAGVRGIAGERRQRLVRGRSVLKLRPQRRLLCQRVSAHAPPPVYGHGHAAAIVSTHRLYGSGSACHPRATKQKGQKARTARTQPFSRDSPHDACSTARPPTPSLHCCIHRRQSWQGSDRDAQRSWEICAPPSLRVCSVRSIARAARLPHTALAGGLRLRPSVRAPRRLWRPSPQAPFQPSCVLLCERGVWKIHPAISSLSF
jgi:hypothetical protein